VKTIDKTQAVNSGYRDEFYHVSLKNADGTPVRCRVNGACKTWKTRPNEFRLPVKHGLKSCFYITEENAHEWYAPYIPENTDPCDGCKQGARCLDCKHKTS
jgi:hypothetical protein